MVGVVISWHRRAGVPWTLLIMALLLEYHTIHWSNNNQFTTKQHYLNHFGTNWRQTTASGMGHDEKDVNCTDKLLYQWLYDYKGGRYINHLDGRQRMRRWSFWKATMSIGWHACWWIEHWSWENKCIIASRVLIWGIDCDSCRICLADFTLV